MASRPSKASRGLAARLTPKDDREFIEQARARFKQEESATTGQRERELEDLEFYDDKQWPQDVLNARAGLPGNAQTGLPPVPARPSLTINKVREPVRQILNQERQAELGVEIVAVDDFGDGSSHVSEAEIQTREGLVRRIQRESQAIDARSWAFQRAVIAGRGFYRVMTKYADGKSMDQEVCVERIYNQASVSMDPAHEQPDGSDAEWEFIGSDLPWDRYTADYGAIDGKPNAVTSASANDWRALGDELPGWFTQDGKTRSVRVVEYFYTERTKRTLIQLQDGSVEYEDELPDGAIPALDEDGTPLTREIIEKQIKWAKIDGVQVLERTDWPSKYMPIVKVLGEEIQPYDSERRAEGMVRPARDSQRGFNTMVSKWVEQIGLAPLPPWMGAAGFDEGFENEYALANTRTLPALHFNSRGVNGEEIAPPTRTSIRMEIEAIAGSIGVFDQAIKSTTAMPDPTLGNVDPTIRSHRQLKTLLDQASQGTSHYLDNLARSIRYEGLIENDLLYPIYGKAGRKTRIMSPKGETKPALLHAPFVPHPETQTPMTMAPMGPGMPPQPVTSTTPGAQQITLTKDATFNCTVKVTKTYDTRREEQESVLSSLVQADPAQMAIVGDLLFKYNDGPGHEELEERYKAVLAPPVQAALKGQQGPDPQMQQLQAENQQLKGLLQSKVAEVQAKGQIDLQKAQLDDQTKLKIAMIQASATMTNTQAKIDAEDARTFIDAMESRLGSQLQFHLEKLGQMHEAIQNQRQMTHEHVQNTLDRQHEQVMGDQAHQQALTQQAQSAALAPSPNGEGT